MEMDRVRPACREGAIQHREVCVSTEAHEAVAVLRIAGIGQGFPAIFDSIPQAMEVLCVGHSSGNHSRLSNHKRPIGYFFEVNRERRLRKSWQRREEGSEKFLGPARADNRQRRSGSSLVFGEDHRIEEIGDEIGKVISVVMGEENVSDSMPVHTGFQEVCQRTRAKVQQHHMVGVDEVA